jgi:four helix bundle protein
VAGIVLSDRIRHAGCYSRVLDAGGIGIRPKANGPRPKGFGPEAIGVLQKVQGWTVANYATFRELVVWQNGMELAEMVHRSTRSFASADLFTIGTQLRRAANSIPANISEGFSRRSRGAYRSHVAIALGSHAEVQTLLELCRRLALIGLDSIRELQSLAEDIGRLLFGLWRSLFVGAVCYSLALAAIFTSLPWAVFQMLGL